MTRLALYWLLLGVALHNAAAPPPLLFAATPSGSLKIIHGVGYSRSYPGSTLDVRVNACIVDAETRANGNTSGICDSSGEGGTQTIAGHIDVGDSANDTVTWLLPAACSWNVTSVGATSNAAINQHPNTAIVGPSINWLNCTVINKAGNGAIHALYQTMGSGYYRAEGFDLANYSYQTVSNAVMLITGAIDTSFYHNIAVQAYNGGRQTGLLVGNNTNNICCSTSFDRLQINMNSSGGIPLEIEGGDKGEPIEIAFYNSTFTHAGRGLPEIQCKDNATHKSSAVNFYNTYIETNSSDLTTSPVQITGCGSVGFYGLDITDPDAASSATGISMGAATASSLVVNGMTQYAGFRQPATAVANALTGAKIRTDQNGHLNSYNSDTSYANDLVVANTLKAGSLAAKRYRVSALPSASVLGAGTQVIVTDATTFTPGRCIGGGGDTMIAVSDGSSWSCH
ncbi:MAG TPA: hypothetical protein VGR96_19085 [Acidobacteriaceae bacterium]|nr:hypothetical protein [Acidobacteriaceae bacterium]